ncbi:hypothetical protein EGW08_002115 [Elysia chlorotica]|uniref:MOSC domain-containing protein n=1 Tax=Elysia chlorotica TaxID=188477 RepID=A0A3S0ZZU3_ELYCH|nr:hypothetical protein EGW08_002115 [Elysia chlorotica]
MKMLDIFKLGEHKGIVLAVVGGAAVATAAVLLMSRREQKYDQYELVGEVSSIHCYPVKSMQALRHDVGFCSFSGIKMLNTRDRQFVVVRPNGDFITQRQISRMAGIKLSVEGSYLKMQADSMPDIKVLINPKKDEAALVQCRVWKDKMLAQDCGLESGQWLSQYLGEDGLRMLVVIPGVTNRDCKEMNSTQADKLIFQDKGPYLLATEESLGDLIRNMDSPANKEITMKNFRPNLVIKGTKEPWDEDNWTHIVIGKNLRMRVLAPLERCLLTTVNPETYERRDDGEPMKTLKR